MIAARLRSLWRNLVHRNRVDQDLDEEVRSYLDLLADEKISQGITSDEARRAARLDLGGVEQVKEEVRDARAGAWLRTLLQDLVYGLRQLRRDPGFTAIVLLTLGLGIGANTAIFSLLNTVVLRPLSYPAARRLVAITQYAPKLRTTLVPEPTYLAWRKKATCLEAFAAYVDHYCDGNLTGGAAPLRIDTCAEATASLFPMLGVRPRLGRLFRPQDDQPGASAVLLLSNAFWRTRFAANPGIIGRSLSLDGRTYTVVGILPANFQYPGDLKPGVLVPLTLAPVVNRDLWNGGGVSVIGRLRPGTQPMQAISELAAISARVTQRYPARLLSELDGARVRMVSLHDELAGDMRPALLMLWGAVGLVLLIACVNVGNLLLARGTARQKEIAVRVALGAGRRRLTRQLVTEGLLLASLGCVAGLLMAPVMLGLVRYLIPASLDRFGPMPLDGAAFAFTLLVSLLTGVLFSLPPAFLAPRFDLHAALQEGGNRATASRGQQRLRGLLASAELGLALILLLGAGLLIRSFANLLAVNPGFNPRHLLTVQVTLTPGEYPNASKQRLFFSRLLKGIGALATVKAVGGTTDLPFYYGFSRQEPMRVEGVRASFLREEVTVPLSSVTPGYFSAMEIPLRAGRFFDGRDNETASRVAVVNGEFVRRFLANANPLGRALLLPASENGPAQAFRIIGVVGNVHYFGRDRGISPVAYVSFAQMPDFALTLAVRGRTASVVSLIPAIRREVQKLNPRQPIYHVRTMEERLADAASPRRFDLILVAIFAALAAVLASVGVYGALSYWVAQRKHEIAIRVALGAQPREIVWLVLRQAFRLAISGIGAGLVLGLALARGLSSLLFRVSPNDSLTFVLAPALLAATVLVACWMPLCRARRVDPIVALRQE